nr:ATP-binding cassette domain-containing protein [bacterium]
MIEINHITKRYGENYAVRDVSFTVNPGEIVGFLGRNGAGKTTTMNIITGYISSTSGTVTIDGYDVLKDPIEVKRRIGYLPELPPLYMDMTVWDYLNFSADLKHLPRKNRGQHIGDICGLVRIGDIRKRLIKNLSKGYKQRVGLAQALIGNPQVLILDEPTVGLDPRQIIEIRNLIRDLGKSHTLILSSHILQEVSYVCERVVIINKGRLVAQDQLNNLLQGVNENRILVARVAGSERAAASIIKNIAGVVSVSGQGSYEPETVDLEITVAPGNDVRRAISTQLVKAGYPLLMFKPMDATLEDIFLRLTDGKDGM